MEAAFHLAATQQFTHGAVIMAIAQAQFTTNLASLQFQDNILTAS